MVKWQATLSTTEPYNYIGIQNVRQGNRNTEVLEAILVENALPLDLTGCEVFFESVIDNKYPIQRAAKIVNAKKGIIQYTFDEYSMQSLHRQEAYFSIHKGDNLIGSTQNFSYFVVNAVSKTEGEMGSYWQSIEDLIADMNAFINENKGDFEEFVNQNREIIESVDPGGLLLSRIGIFESFRERDFSVIEKMKNEFSERGVNVKWFGAIGDGESDDTAAIQDAIRFAKTTKSKTYFPSGNYRLTEELILLEGTYLLCDGNVRFLRDHDRNFTLNFELTDEPFNGYEGYGNITVDGGYWDFHSNNTADGQCFFFAHAKNVKIQNAHVKDVSGGHAVEVNSTDGMIIRNCIFEGYQGENFRGAIQIDLDKEGAFGDLYVDHQSFDYTVSKNVLVENCKFLSSELGSWGRAVESHSAVVDRQF